MATEMADVAVSDTAASVIPNVPPAWPTKKSTYANTNTQKKHRKWISASFVTAAAELALEAAETKTATSAERAAACKRHNPHRQAESQRTKQHP